jgi:hypothetical protein
MTTAAAATSSSSGSTVRTSELRRRMEFLTSTQYWQHEFRQASALTHVEREPLLTMVAKDKPNSHRAAREYYAATLRSLYETLVTMPREMRNYYEWITDTRPCHFYIDFEYYPEFNADDDEHPFEARRALVLKLVVDEIGKVCSARRVHVIETDASKRGKRSRHYVLHVDGHLFENQFHCGALQRHVQLAALKRHGPAADNPYFGWTVSAEHSSRAADGNARQLPVMDHGVYTRARILRVAWATKYKPGEYRPLLPLAQWVAYRDGPQSSVWHNAAGVCDQNHALPGAVGMCECACERYDPADMQEPRRELFLECLVQAQTERFLETCSDDVCRIIRVTEPDDRTEARSSMQLMNGTQRGSAVPRRGLGQVSAPNMLLHAMAMERAALPSEIDLRALEKQYGATAHMTAREAALLRASAPIRVEKATGGDDDDAGAAPVASVDSFLAAFADNETFARESAWLCAMVIEEICALRQHMPVVTRRENVSYIRNYGPSLVFLYQLDSGFCTMCGYEHSSNHVKVVVQLSPHASFHDEQHPGAPVFYFKCYKWPERRTPPHALPSYLASADMRARIDALCMHVRQTFMVQPREFLAYLLAPQDPST